MSRLDPRRHLAAAIGWAVLAVVALASLAAGELAASDAQRAARAASQRLMVQFATQVRDGLMLALQTRQSIIQATAAQIATSVDLQPDALGRHLDAIRHRFPEFAWLGVAEGRDKTIVAAVGDRHADCSVRSTISGDTAGALAVLPGTTPRGPSPSPSTARDRLPAAASQPDSALQPDTVAQPDIAPKPAIVLVAPMRRAGSESGRVIACVAWSWIDGLRRSLAGSLDSHRRLQSLLIDPSGRVLAGPAPWFGRTVGVDTDLTEGGRYLVGRTPEVAPGGEEPGWSVAVRQAADSALADVRHLYLTVLATVLAAGFVAAAAALLLTAWITRRLQALAREAHAVRLGRRSQFAAPPGDDEVGRIGAALSELVGHLQREKAALTRLNAELDARVAERTARIERMADEARHAAVARERLRLARDLHDTLAHSLMALLQQIRLVRKLRDRMSGPELGAELQRAEEVAAAGLAEARQAITQMRHGTVGEVGLAAALRDLVARFGERTGARTSIVTSGAAADLADERGEALYRIAEEALRNVERHARAEAVEVVVSDLPGDPVPSGRRVFLEVRDDGVGFDPDAPHPGHYGVPGMREQAALVDARLVVSSRPGAGTVIRAEFVV